MAEPLLELREVSAGYGDGIVLDHVSVALPEGGYALDGLVVVRPHAENSK